MYNIINTLSYNTIRKRIFQVFFKNFSALKRQTVLTDDFFLTQNSKLKTNKNYDRCYL